MKGIKAIKTFFEEGESGRKVTVSEMKQLSPEDRKELGQLACKALGEDYEEPGM